MSAPATSRSPRRTAAAFGALVLVAALAALYVRQRGEPARLRVERDAWAEQLAATTAAAADMRAELAQARAEASRLAAELAAPRREEEETRQRIEKLERVLSAQFGRLAQAEMLVVSSAADRMSVAVAVAALFPSSSERLTKHGRALLCDISETILRDYAGQIRVTGYYGKPALASRRLAARHKSPWQLSAARAATAAHALERDCGVPPERFFVVGYGPRAAGPIGESVAFELIFTPRD